MSLLEQTAIYLGAAVLVVPLTKRLGFGALLGYLAAGVIIGPWGLRLIREVDSIMHFAELGVVFLMFIIGLELQPSRLWALRKTVFGTGLAQVVITGAVIAIVANVAGLNARAAILVGVTLALSSTAFALQLLAERRQLTTRHGRVAFGILLFQDLAVVPLLALIPLLGHRGTILVDDRLWFDVLEVVLVLAVVIVGGHYLLRPVLRAVAATKVPELFTALALLVVIGTALLMEAAGLSMALGAFLAGVLLADSEYRHALEADIEPFKGLLLGLFFIAVGMALNIGLVTEQPITVLALVVALVAVKSATLFGLGRKTGLSAESSRGLAVVLSQGGEFAFVLFVVAVGAGVIDQQLADLLIVVVTFSMVATPLLFMLNESFGVRAIGASEKSYEKPAGEENPVIIAGFGRFGQIIARILRARKIGFTALDISSEQVDFVKKYGSKIYYGDASRLDLLRAAKADKARIFVLAIDDVEASLRTADTIRQHFPNLKIYARARNRQHVYQLMDRGIQVIRRETFESSLDMARQVLQGLGMSKAEAEQIAATFKQHDLARLYSSHSVHDDEEKMALLAKEYARELEELFEQDAKSEL